MDDRLVISLLRHGLTLENERRAYIGWTDSPLSRYGKNELNKKQLNLPSPSYIFSSPLKRCIETANIFFPNERICIMNEFKELHFGAWEGKTYDQLKTNELYRNWLSNIFGERIEDGETFSQFKRRVHSGLQILQRTIIKKCPKHIVIVTHAGVIRLILHTLFPNQGSYFDWPVPFGDGYELTWQENQFEKENDTCTLLSAAPIMVKQIGSNNIII